MTIAANNAPCPLAQSLTFFAELPTDSATKNTFKIPSDDSVTPRVFPQEAALVEAYVGVVERKATGKIPGWLHVPTQTLLGQWLELYRAQLQHPVVQSWMREQKVDVATLSVNPSTGAMSAEVDGVKKNFALTDGSGWRQVSGPLLAAGKVLVPAADQNLQIRPGTDWVGVPVKLVASFHGEPLPTNKAQAARQIRRLEQNKSFDPIASDDRLRPASRRSEQALELQKNSASLFYASAPQKLAYERLAIDVAKAMPDVRAEAKKWAEALIFKLTGQHVDADQIYLNRFSGSQSASSATGWEHMNEEPSVSLRLPDALLKNFSEHDGIPGELDLQAGLYKDGPGKSGQDGYGAHNQFPLAPSTLMHASWKTDFQTRMTQKIDSFWSAHTDDYGTAIKGEFAYQARKQLNNAQTRLPAERALQAPEHQFTRDDYRLVMGAVSNLPLDENAPLSVEQLKAKAPVKGIVQAHALNIHGFTSSDIVRFSAADGGRQVLYVPGAQPAFLRFDSLEKLDQWVTEQTKTPKKRESLAAHFPLAYRQDHEASFVARAAKTLMPVLWFSHVGEKTEGLDTLFEKIATGKQNGPAINGSHSQLEGDVFSILATASMERMKSDADVVIKSNSEVIRDTWLNDITVAAGLLAKLAPIAAPVAAAAVVTGLTELSLGAEKASSGDTETERKDGNSKAFDGVLNTLFSVAAGGSLEDPFLPPEETPITPTSGERPQIKSPPIGSEVNRLRPSQAGNISEHAVPNGEQLIENAPRNAKGIYQIKDAASGGDHWYIRYTDATGVRQVYEIKGDFKPSNDYVQIIDRTTGKPVMTVHATAQGDWARGIGAGGARKWFWQRQPSLTPSDDAKIPPKISDAFLDLNGAKLKGAEKIDEYLQMDGNADYEFSSRNIEEDGVIKSRIGVSWTLPENNFQIEPAEKAVGSIAGSSEYSQSFVKDIHRFDYTVVVKQGSTETRTALKSTAGSAEGKIEERLSQFEALISDPKLRARISEVAHQGALAPATTFMNLPSTGLQDGFYLGGGDTQIIIEYDAEAKQANVTFESKNPISNPDLDLAKVPGVEITTKRTFTITESNEVQDSDAVYVIDKQAPSKMELSVVVP